MPKLYLCVALAVVLNSLTAQIRCATEKFDSVRRSNNPQLETKHQFENWMRLKIQNSSPTARTQGTQATYTVPVVVHIIHNNEPVGSGPNISDAQVLSQINVLNKDFQRMNADASQTPSAFASVAGSMSLEFVLAKQDQFGNATTGIERVDGGKPVWSLYEDTELKSKSYWPAEQYLNIWVTNFPEYLGYTQFPVSNLQGISNSSEDRLTDGIIIHYRAFGSVDDGDFDLESQYNKGRTLTHEMGHFFGLRHIWGDANSCSATDYVSDTPPQIGSTLFCPSHPATECSGQAKMFQNYLDYTDDRCMNLFTAGQVTRMEMVINNSPRRKSLLTSAGSFPPGTYSLDLGIISIQSPATLECSGAHTPSIIIRNFGTATITQANIEFKMDGNSIETKSFALNLQSLTQMQVTFNDYVSSPADSKTYQFTITSVNGSADDYPDNNTLSVITKTSTQGALPYSENFESGLNGWDVINPDALTGWTTASLPNSAGNALFIENYNYENEGAVDKIISPVFDVSSTPALLLKFRYAFAQYPGVVGDALSVYVIDDCTENLSNATRVFFKEGPNLSTAPSTGSYFVPAASQWATQYVSLQDFIGSSNLRVAFVSRNGYGNNIYLDDIQLFDESINNLSIVKLLEPSMAVCESSVSPRLLISNNGTENISTLTIATTKNGSGLPTQVMNVSLPPGQSAEININTIPLSSGINNFIIGVTPNGPSDQTPDDNVISIPVTRIENSSFVPIRENFNLTPQWSVVNTGASGWTFEETDYSTFGTSAAFKAFNFPTIGEQSWLVSPKLDFSKAIEASIFAHFSYGQRIPADELITVAASTNCGRTFDHVFFSNGASVFTGDVSAMPWNPSAESDWERRYFNINALAGYTDVLLTFQITNQNGNNLYLDNIEIFENDDATPTEVDAPFRLYVENGITYLTFNLEEALPSRVQVASIMGSILADETVDHALNQTLTFNLGANPAIYIFNIQIGSKTYALRQYMAR